MDKIEKLIIDKALKKHKNLLISAIIEGLPKQKSQNDLLKTYRAVGKELIHYNNGRNKGISEVEQYLRGLE